MIFISILILIVAIALPSFNKHLSPILFTRISSIIFIYAGALSLNALYIQSIGSGIGIYSGLFHVTVVSQLIEVFILFIGSLILVSWPNINNISNQFNNQNAELVKTNNVATEYSLLVLFTTLGALLLVSSNDLISMYLSIELQSFGLYILATLYRDSESATKAGLKYFLLGGLSSCLILLGAGLIYTYTGLTNFESIYTLISALDSNNILQGFSLGLILIVVGFLFKIAAAPLHNWAPDVYDDSPTIVTIWLTIMPKISIIILLLELQVEIGLIGQINSISNNSIELMPNMITNINTFIAGENISYVLKNLLLLSSLLSLIIGTVLGLAQNRIKRLLAYSTISHVGFILLAIAINTEQSIDSLIFYIIQYSLTNLNTFLIIIALGYTLQNQANKLINFNINNKDINYVDIRYINSLKGIFANNPILSLSLSICLFSMAGMPPLIGFFSKQFVLSSAIQSGYYFMAIIAIIVSVISASYYLKVIKVLHNNEESSDNELVLDNNITSNIKEDSWKEVENNLSTTSSTNENNNFSCITNYHSFLISSLTLSILLFVLKPSIILNSTQLLSLSIFNY